ncbi:MAG: hypothetical protein KC492_11710, partial [Myxococcales bacterium]|nr:hypothetical protein [Myxococcales bacterium]
AAMRAPASEPPSKHSKDASAASDQLEPNGRQPKPNPYGIRGSLGAALGEQREPVGVAHPAKP